MPRIAAMARKNQPGIIIVDRDVHGPYENYRTPEQKVPASPLPYPWETCMTMATSWSYVPNDVYKLSRELIHTLVDVVAKGGNFLLNIGVSPEGEFAPDAYARLRDIGDWLKINGEAIYKTRPIAPYKQGKLAFTSLPDGTVFAIYLADVNESAPPQNIGLRDMALSENAKITLLGSAVPLSWKRTPEGTHITIPAKAIQDAKGRFAWVVKISRMEK